MRKVSIIVFVVLLFSALFLPAEFSAKTVSADTLDGYTKISTADQLKALSGKYLTGKYYLAADIDLDGGEWTPIYALDGATFDGNNRTISNFKITTHPTHSSGTFCYVGFLGYTYNSATILNLKLSGVSIDVGGCEGMYAGALAGQNGGNIINCHAKGQVSVRGYSSAGGLAGANTNLGSIRFCSADVNVTSVVPSSSVNSHQSGGLLGRDTNGSIAFCTASGNVSATDNFATTTLWAGGLIGNSYYATINNCSASGNVTASTAASASLAGGLFGYRYGSTVKNCSASGDVRATAGVDCYAGGFAGRLNYATTINCYATGGVYSTAGDLWTAYAGGIAGRGYNLQYCYATGNVEGRGYSKYVGGLAGDCTSITNCFATGDISYSGAGLSGEMVYIGNISAVRASSYGNNYYSSSQICAANNGTPATATNPSNFMLEGFMTNTLGWGKYKNDADVLTYENNVWVFESGSLPILYTENKVFQAVDVSAQSENKIMVMFTKGSATLDGQPYTSGTVISDVGYYEFSHTFGGETVTQKITIDAIINGLYSSDAVPTVKNATLTLNGQPFESGTAVRKVGNYTLVVSGKGGYEKTEKFTIEPNISGVWSGGYYYNAVTPYVPHCDLLLDGKPFESGTIVSKLGIYELTVLGVGGYRKYIDFTVASNTSPAYDVSGYYDHYFVSISMLTDNYKAYLDGKRITENAYVYNAGNHLLVITDDNVTNDGAHTRYYFTVPDNIQIDKAVHTEPIEFVGANADIYIDGIKQNGDFEYFESGKHTLKIVGENGYERVFEFECITSSNGWLIALVIIFAVAAIATALIFAYARRGRR